MRYTNPRLLYFTLHPRAHQQVRLPHRYMTLMKLMAGVTVAAAATAGAQSLLVIAQRHQRCRLISQGLPTYNEQRRRR